MKPTWTPAAAETLERFLNEARARSRAPGVDPDEVVADLRRHIDEEIARAGLAAVTDTDLTAILGRIGSGVEAGVSPSADTAERGGYDAHVPGAAEPRAVWQHAVLALGIVVPFVTILIELLAHWCAEEFFDPLPTLFHVAAASLVPLANGVAWMWLQRKDRVIPSWLWIANGLAAGAGLYFSILFAPATPFAFIGIIIFGIGLLPLSPLFSFISCLVLRRWMGRRSDSVGAGRPRGWLAAFAVAFAALALALVPEFATRQKAQLAVSGDDGAADAVRWLRRWGAKDQLLLDCYGQQRGTVANFLTQPIAQHQARELFYRVTGEPFNAVKPPTLLQSRRNRFVFDEWELDGAEWDGALGGESVAGRVRGLALNGSRLDGILGADEATSYVEWTLEFKNVHERSDREARAQIQLPPGGVVSRLTLWVNGEEREAAFAGRQQVREAYQKVAVVQRRDPVLVSTCGPDRVLVQCFPVPAKGGTMKIRLGITAPLRLASADDGVLHLPTIVERNFGLGEGLAHSVWLEASQPLRSASAKLKVDSSKPGRPGLHGELPDQELTGAGNAIHVQRNASASLAWAEDDVRKDGSFIRQTLTLVTNEPPGRVAIVIDGSAGMNPALSEVAGALSTLPAQADIATFIAGDGVRAYFGSEWRADHLGAIRMLRATGGQDNQPALGEGWDWAAARQSGVVIWIHAPQPVLLQSTAPLRQRFEWRSGMGAPVVYDFQTRPGPNRIAETIDDVAGWELVPREGSLRDDLTALLQRLSARSPSVTVRRERVPGGPTTTDRAAKHASSHLVRLAAKDEVRTLVNARRVEEAAVLGARYQLVTPASGAVVLENQQQYQQSGLQPVDPTTVPLVPEPGTVALLLMGGIALLIAVRRRA